VRHGKARYGVGRRGQHELNQGHQKTLTIAYEAVKARDHWLFTFLAAQLAGPDKEEVAALSRHWVATFADHGSQVSCGLWGEALSSDFCSSPNLSPTASCRPGSCPRPSTRSAPPLISACREAEDDIVERAASGLQRQIFRGSSAGHRRLRHA
jgi:hypothetical protein